MADANEEDSKKKSSLLKILIFTLVGVVLLAAAVGGTLLLTGYFDKRDTPSAEARLAETEAAVSAPKSPEKGPEPKLVTKQSPELTRFQHTYLEMERELLANVTNSRKVMQVQLALMTRYDQRVFKNVKKHEFALRSAALDVMRKTTEPEIAEPDFRKKLAESIRQEMNAILEKFEDFGGIEEVYFTSFVVQ